VRQSAETVNQHREELDNQDDAEEYDEQHTDRLQLQILFGDGDLKSQVTFSKRNVSLSLCSPHMPCRKKPTLFLKNVVFWDVALCRSCVNRRFGGTYRLHLQGRKIREW
jgi:hypothetical protein